MKKILIFLVVPALLFAIEVKKKGTFVPQKSKIKISTRVYELKRDTLDKDEDGVLDKFIKKLREEEKKKKIETKKKIKESEKNPDYRRKLRYR